MSNTNSSQLLIQLHKSNDFWTSVLEWPNHIHKVLKVRVVVPAASGVCPWDSYFFQVLLYNLLFLGLSPLLDSKYCWLTTCFYIGILIWVMPTSDLHFCFNKEREINKKSCAATWVLHLLNASLRAPVSVFFKSFRSISLILVFSPMRMFACAVSYTCMCIHTHTYTHPFSLLVFYHTHTHTHTHPF